MIVLVPDRCLLNNEKPVRNKEKPIRLTESQFVIKRLLTSNDEPPTRQLACHYQKLCCYFERPRRLKERPSRYNERQMCNRANLTHINDLKVRYYQTLTRYCNGTEVVISRNHQYKIKGYNSSKVKGNAMVRNNTIISHIPPSNLKEEEAQTQIDKRSRK